MYNANIYRYGKIENLKKAIKYWTNRIEYMENNNIYIKPNIKKHLKELNNIYNQWLEKSQIDRNYKWL